MSDKSIVKSKSSFVAKPSKPNFLIVGGMKCGSTTLYNDLRKHSRVKFPGKETSFFSDVSSVKPESQEEYLKLFDSSFVSGDCSTRYAMLPTYSGVAERAWQMLGDQVRIIYMVRNPIERAISHHHHLQARDATRLGFDDAIVRIPEIVDYSRYEMQLEPWLNTFGESALMVLPIEDYNANWRDNINKLASHLTIDPEEFQGTQASHANKTNEARVLKGVYRKIYDSRVFDVVYKNGLKTMLPEKARNVSRHVLLPKPPQRENPPSTATLQMLAEKLKPAVEAVASLNSRCCWDLQNTVERLTAKDTVP